MDYQTGKKFEAIDAALVWIVQVMKDNGLKLPVAEENPKKASE